MIRGLYRKEAIEYKRVYWKGKALLLIGMSVWLIIVLPLLFLGLLISAMTFCSFTQRIDVNGEVITLPHPVNAYASQQGFIVSQYVKVGDLAKKGQPLHEIDISRNTITGSASPIQIEVNKEKIANVEETINKFSQNKQRTLSSIEKQFKVNKESLKGINRLLVNASAGLKKMHDNLSSYDSYLRDGLITKDQYNHQHSLYFQQQDTYQSLVSQKMQLESRIIQCNSDKITKIADFDDQIAVQQNQINDFKNQLVESNAKGNVTIKATTEGCIESLSVTKRQMIDNGSSLAQIKPTGNTEYYLILWLPNNSTPYVKLGNVINICYDAFPSDELEQFPGEVVSIFSVLAPWQEMSEYTNVSNGTSQQEPVLYKAIVKIKNKTFSYNGKTLKLSNGPKARAVVFLEKRPLYMWMFTPFYKVSQSVSGLIYD